MQRSHGSGTHWWCIDNRELLVGVARATREEAWLRCGLARKRMRKFSTSRFQVSKSGDVGFMEEHPTSSTVVVDQSTNKSSRESPQGAPAMESSIERKTSATGRFQVNLTINSNPFRSYLWYYRSDFGHNFTLLHPAMNRTFRYSLSILMITLEHVKDNGNHWECPMQVHSVRTQVW